MYIVLAPSSDEEDRRGSSDDSQGPSREDLTGTLRAECLLSSIERSDLEPSSPAWLLEALQDRPSGTRVYKTGARAPTISMF